jgi:RimJ/RimL family protein N-acetyltransferase
MFHGKKVSLRAITRDDLEKILEFQNDVEVELASGGDPPAPYSLDRIRANFEADLNRPVLDVINFAIEADGKYIGSCGLFHVDPIGHTAELGIIIGDKDYWGKGYGRDAVSLLLEYAFRYRNFHKVYLKTNGRNERAICAYRACGFVEEGRLREQVYSDGRYDDAVYMGILRKEWEGAERST